MKKNHNQHSYMPLTVALFAVVAAVFNATWSQPEDGRFLQGHTDEIALKPDLLSGSR